MDGSRQVLAWASCSNSFFNAVPMFEEFLKSLHIKPESWILSSLFTSIITVYRIVEPDEPVTWKKAVRIISSGLACTVVIPGLLRYYCQNEDPFVASALSGLTAYCFEPVLKIISNLLSKRLLTSCQATINMEIVLTRRWQGNASTLGTLTVNGGAHHFILEDKDRGLDSKMSLDEIAHLKVKKETAIPTGRYQVIVSHSTRFKRLTPRLVNVPGYSGILIHPGNRIRNTEGCLLPGLTNFIEDKEYCVGQSKTAFERLFGKILDAHKRREEIWITIRTDYK
jgi:hypothetical protein